MSNKQEVAVRQEQQVTASTINNLTELANQTIEIYKETHPIFSSISNKILEMFNNDQELNNLEAKDLFKLLEIANKNQLAPINELTKLVTQLNNLQDRMDAHKEVETLRNLVEEMTRAKEEAEEADIVDAEEIDIEITRTDEVKVDEVKVETVVELEAEPTVGPSKDLGGLDIESAFAEAAPQEIKAVDDGRPKSTNKTIEDLFR